MTDLIRSKLEGLIAIQFLTTTSEFFYYRGKILGFYVSWLTIVKLRVVSGTGISEYVIWDEKSLIVFSNEKAEILG